MESDLIQSEHCGDSKSISEEMDATRSFPEPRVNLSSSNSVEHIKDARNSSENPSTCISNPVYEESNEKPISFREENAVGQTSVTSDMSSKGDSVLVRADAVPTKDSSSYLKSNNQESSGSGTSSTPNPIRDCGPAKSDNLKPISNETTGKEPCIRSSKMSKKYLIGENHERMNYLLQACSLINSRSDAESFSPAGSSLGSLAMAIGRKCVIRMNHDLKRQFCKGCGTALIPGVSSKYRLRKNRQKHLVVTCLRCKTIRRFPSNPDYVLWNDRSEAFVE